MERAVSISQHMIQIQLALNVMLFMQPQPQNFAHVYITAQTSFPNVCQADLSSHVK